MNKTINTTILLRTDTTNNWETVSNSLVPKLGEVCIYLDKFQTINEANETIYIPGIKIGNGVDFIGKLEFIRDRYITDEEIDSLLAINTLDNAILDALVLE